MEHSVPSCGDIFSVGASCRPAAVSNSSASQPGMFSLHHVSASAKWSSFLGHICSYFPCDVVSVDHRNNYILILK